MPIRIPKAKRTEILIFAGAGVAAFAPFYMMTPGAGDRLEAQTLHWAPRWEKNIGYFIPHAEKNVQRMSPHVEKAVQAVDRKLPLEKTAQRVDRGIKKGIDVFQKEKESK